ncbi:MAG: carboxypeptidase-like regulatory domain-containing protein, partial [Holophaga sp.]
MARSKSFTGFSALMLVLAAAPAALMAQTSTTSALTGLVRDANGQPFAGATVRISSPAMIGGEKVMKTAANGSYRFPVLPPGRYKIVVEAPGMPTQTGSETLELGRTSAVNWKLQKVASATVEVSETTNSLDPAPTGLGKSFSLEELDNLPYKRDLSSIADLTPGVNGGVAWGGDRRNANAYMMDGMNVGDPGLGTPWIYANPEWFSEVQVGGIGAPAEYGGFTGGFINAILKRGGNKTEGAFNGYYSTSNWQAKTSN